MATGAVGARRGTVSRQTVLLVQPRASSEWVYPLALATLVPLLRAAGHRVLGLDLQREPRAALPDRVERESVDWVGLPVMAHTALDVASLLLRARQRRAVRTWVQGVWPSIEPQLCLEQTGADWCVVGDPERVVLELLAGEGPRGPGLGRLHRGRLEGGAAAARVPMAELPLPDRELFPVRPYGYAMRALRLPYGAVVTSRGCPLRCPLCSVPARRPGGLDGRPPQQVVDEISALVREHGVRSILVEDDAFLADPDRAAEIGRLLEAARLRVVLELVNGVRPHQANDRLFAQLAAGGFRRIVYGFEHVGAVPPGSVGCSERQARLAVGMARRHGMRVGGYFVVGLPGLSRREVLGGLARALALGLDDANFLPWYQDPGSAWRCEPPPAMAPAEAARLARLAQGLFFGQPRAAGRLALDLMARPGALGALVGKAGEALLEGGPVPVRDSP